MALCHGIKNFILMEIGHFSRTEQLLILQTSLRIGVRRIVYVHCQGCLTSTFA